MPWTRLDFPAERRLGAPIALAMLALGVALSASPASAVLYKWTDANGRVSYSDQPPPGNVKAEIVNGAPAASNPEAVRELATQDQDLKKLQAQRADAQKKADRTRAETALQEQACVEARGRVRLYESDQVISRINEKGEQVFLDDTMKNREKEKLEAQIRERCPG
jgi:hypothetical protein